MDFKRILVIVALAAGIVLVAVFSWKIGGNHGYSAGYSDALASIKPDTVKVTDTIEYYFPKEVVKWKDRLVYVPVTDTIVRNDTTYIALQFEKKEYKDTNYRAVVSGYEPALDYIETYNHTTYITKVVPEYKYPTFALSPSVDAFAIPGHFSLGGGLDLDYWRGRWQLSAEGGYGIHSDFKTITTGWYGKIGAKYNLIRKY